MKAEDKIRLFEYINGVRVGMEDYVVEEFRHCLGIFRSENHREMGDFIPLCDLYEEGPESERKYMPNMGEYITNKVPMWMEIP